MLSFNGKGEVKKVVLSKLLGDEKKKNSVKVTLEVPAMPVDVAEAGFVGQLSLVYGASEVEPQLSGLKPFRLGRTIDNVSVAIGKARIEGADVSKVTLEPLRGKVVRVKMELEGPVGKGAVEKLHEALFESTSISLIERKVEIEDDEEEDNVRHLPAPREGASPSPPA